MNRADIVNHLRRTEQRIEAAEKQQRRERKFQRKNAPVLDALENVASGLIRGQEMVETHALKQRR
jgi:hypothetical protein